MTNSILKSLLITLAIFAGVALSMWSVDSLGLSGFKISMGLAAIVAFSWIWVYVYGMINKRKDPEVLKGKAWAWAITKHPDKAAKYHTARRADECLLKMRNDGILPDGYQYKRIDLEQSLKYVGWIPESYEYTGYNTGRAGYVPTWVLGAFDVKGMLRGYLYYETGE